MTGIDGFSLPMSRVQSTLQRDTAAGTISATDETALTSALGDIQAQVTGTGTTSGATSATGTTSTGPTSMKDRVDAAIDNEVSSGKLTSDQATELKNAFQQVHAHMHGAHGHHGGGEGGLLAALTGSSATTDASSTDTTTSDTTTNGATTNPVTSVATSAMSAIENFIAQFQSATSSNALYGANGANGSSATSLLINAIG